jgi:hypothetical protein
MSTPKTVCIRQKQNFGFGVGVPTQRQRLLQPWAEVEIFDGNADKLLASLVAAQDQKDAAREAERAARREAARAREPKRCSPALSKPELLKLRPDPELMQMAKDEPPINEVCKPLWMTHPPEFFVSQLFNEDDLVSAVHAYGGGVVQPFAEIQKKLGAFSAININPLTRSKEPKRKRIGVHFGIGYWRQLSFLMREAELILLVCGARDGGLYAIFDCERWPQKRLTDFAVQTVKRGGEAVDRIPMPGAPAASLNGTIYEFLHRAGFVRDQEQYKPRNFVLHWRASESLPPVPPRGRRA